MTELAQAYFHFSGIETDQSLIDKIGEVAAELASIYGRETYSETPIHVSVELQEGSVKGWVTVASLLTSIFSVTSTAGQIILKYPEFKQNLSVFMDDARSFAGKLNEKMADQINVPNEDVVRMERRTKTIGKLWRAIHELEYVVEHQSRLTDGQIDEHSTRARELIDSAKHDLSLDDQKKLEKIIGDKFPEAPRPSMLLVADRTREYSTAYSAPPWDDNRARFFRSFDLIPKSDEVPSRRK